MLGVISWVKKLYQIDIIRSDNHDIGLTLHKMLDMWYGLPSMKEIWAGIPTSIILAYYNCSAIQQLSVRPDTDKYSKCSVKILIVNILIYPRGPLEAFCFLKIVPKPSANHHLTWTCHHHLCSLLFKFLHQIYVAILFVPPSIPLN